MKVAQSALLSLIYFAHETVGQGCTGLVGSVILENLVSCDYAALLAAYEDKYNDPINECDGVTAVEDFHAKLGASNVAQAKAAVKQICKNGYDAKGYTPFTDVAMKGTDYRFEKEYFDGNSYWNEEVETLYNYPIDEASQNLRHDADSVDEFKEGPGENSQVEFPTNLSNFDSCEMNAAFCCWVSDRQANDNNGNCATPYDVNCVDKDPGDNTDLCYVDMPRGNGSTKFSSTGMAIFPEDDNNNSDNAEGPIHCHGFAWANDDNDPTARFKGNNLMFVSMYDHMHQRGYVRNVPGAPMCGCAEQMPVVSRSDCTQIDVEEEYTVTFLGEGSGPDAWKASLDYIDVNFNACQGENNQNNDLWAYFRRLYFEKKVNADQLAALSRVLVEDDNCEYAVEHILNQKGFHRGFDANVQNGGSNWHHLAGRDYLQRLGGNLGAESFNDLYAERENGIIERACATCDPSHQFIYLRYAEGFTPQENILKWLKTSYPRDANIMGKYGEDFALYSTFADALARENAWACEYNYNAYFPGDCGPDGQVTGQGSAIERSWTGADGKESVGFYMQSSFNLSGTSRSVGAVTFTGTQINSDYHQEGSFHVTDEGTIYIRGTGGDIWGQRDSGYFMHHIVEEGDLTLKVHIDSWDDVQHWSKGCLMLRQSLDIASPYFSVCIYGNNGFGQQWRLEAGANSGAWTSMHGQDINSGWIMLSKKGTSFTTFLSEDGENWELYGDVRNVPNLVSDSFYAGFMLTPNNRGLMAEAQLDSYEYLEHASKIACTTVPDL